MKFQQENGGVMEPWFARATTEFDLLDYSSQNPPSDRAIDNENTIFMFIITSFVWLWCTEHGDQDICVSSSLLYSEELFGFTNEKGALVSWHIFQISRHTL